MKIDEPKPEDKPIDPKLKAKEDVPKPDVKAVEPKLEAKGRIDRHSQELAGNPKSEKSLNLKQKHPALGQISETQSFLL